MKVVKEYTLNDFDEVKVLLRYADKVEVSLTEDGKYYVKALFVGDPV